MKDLALRTPYLMQTAASFERQLPAKSTLAITYTNAIGVHELRSEVLNAAANPLFLMTSSGVYRQNQVIFNVVTKFNPAISLNSYYALNRAMSNTDGLSTFPANPANFAGEYGPAATDIRNRFLIAGTINLRWNIRVNPNVTLQSGAPFNITTGEDYYGTTLFNARPGIAAAPGRVLCRRSTDCSTRIRNPAKLSFRETMGAVPARKTLTCASARFGVLAARKARVALHLMRTMAAVEEQRSARHSRFHPEAFWDRAQLPVAAITFRWACRYEIF